MGRSASLAWRAVDGQPSRPAVGSPRRTLHGKLKLKLAARDGRLESLSAGGMLLGMAADASFTCGRVELRGGGLPAAYSDGVVESRNRADQENDARV